MAPPKKTGLKSSENPRGFPCCLVSICRVRLPGAKFTDPCKPSPIDLRRHRREVYGEPARTGPLGRRLAAEHGSGRRVASRRSLRFLLELQVQRRQCRAEAERSRREQHFLNR
jgi:hypothetical protein